MLAKVRLEGDVLHLAFLAELATSKALPHETVESGESRQVVLTASTDDLRKFLLSVGNQPDFFEEETALCRVQ